MITERKILHWLQASAGKLLEAGRFANGDVLRQTQREALEAYVNYLTRTDLKVKEKLVGFFRMPTATGKTAVFLGILNEVYKLAEAAGEEIKVGVIAPRNNLLRQTSRAARKYAPDLAHKVGLYGGGRKDLSKPLTIMTYDAWVALTEAGEIGSHNIHILISDESHRGLSERRIARIYEHYQGATALVAFTATVRFDLDKSVELTHHREIYGRDVRPAIEANELSAYARVQFHVVRVKPVEDEEAKLEDNPDLLLQLRKKAWTQRNVAILRDGVDPETGDPLSDSISGFYTADIQHAIDTEAALNNDEVLAAKARRLGFDGVAIALHSKMLQREQTRRLDAFEIGRYMVVVGDEMMKEGHDHPPLKNIFDWQRGSAVDKGQIIGRALRKYFDPVRDRWLGATIIDTVIYSGHEDSSGVDAQRRRRALHYAVKAWDILDGAVIYGTGDKPRSNRDRPVDFLPSVVIDGQEVESWIEQEDVKTIKSLVDEIGTLDPDYLWLDVPDADDRSPRQKLRDERRRAGLASVAIMERLAETGVVPDGLTTGVIDGWLRNDNVKTARIEWLELVLEAYEQCETANKAPTVNLDEADNAGVTARQMLLGERDRTGLAGMAIWRKLSDTSEVPQGLTINTIQDWLYNEGQKTARTDWLKLVIEAYRVCPTVVKMLTVLDEPGPSGVTPRQKLKTEQQRTGLGAKAIWHRLSEQGKVPDGLSAGNIATWLNNDKQKTAPTDWLTLILKTYESCETAVEVLRTDLNVKDAMGVSPRQKLQSERDRTGLAAIAIWQRLSDSRMVPDGLSYQIIQTWLKNSNVSTARTDWFKLVLDAYADCETIAKAPTVLLDEEGPSGVTPRQRLKHERNRSGLATKAFWPKIIAGGKLPEGLTKTIIDSWLNNGIVKTARADWLELVMETYQSCETPQHPGLKKETKAPALRR